MRRAAVVDGPADLLRLAGFCVSLGRIFRSPLDPAAARAILEDRLATRERRFLSLARRAIFDAPGSPYRRLLALAGCEYGDLEGLVVRDGLEAALGALARRGVFLTVDEAKGRSPVVRGATSFTLDSARLANPLAAAHVVSRTSGGTIVSLDASHFRDRAVNTGLCLDARGGRRWRHGLWVVPGGAAMVVLAHHGALGMETDAWFSQVDPRDPGLPSSYAWSTRALRFTARAVGARLPHPVWAPREAPDRVVRWVRRGLDAGAVPHLITFPSSAAALASAAREAGVDLGGARLSIGGEPVTAARLAAIRAAGAAALPHYGSMEAGRIGEGCLAPDAPDDVHLFHDLHGVVQAGPDLDRRLSPRALLVTALQPSSPVVLLNVSLGDQAELISRRCGCPLDALGWTTHLHAIRSHEKLTAAGMNLLDVDAIAALEEALPARFGGGPLDYQLVEDEGPGGRPRLVLVVSPRVGPVDPAAVARAFLERLGEGAGVSRLTSLLWREPGLIRVERRWPAAAGAGKIRHAHAGTDDRSR